MIYVAGYLYQRVTYINEKRPLDSLTVYTSNGFGVCHEFEWMQGKEKFLTCMQQEKFKRY